MITPRHTRLLRVPSLTGMHDLLTGQVAALDPISAADTFILVPTRAAAEQLRRTVEDRLLTGPATLSWPAAGPRADLYRDLMARAPRLLEVLSPFEREVILGRLAREVAATGLTPPFALRPALVAEMVALYDHIRRQARTVADFERNLLGELEPAMDTDRGAAQLVVQTRFLAAVFHGYERHLAAQGLLDEHGARAVLATEAPARPLRHLVVTVADRAADPDGLWPVDFSLLTTLPHLTHLDIIATEAMLAAGFLERIHAALPGLEEVHAASVPGIAIAPMAHPRLQVPSPDSAIYAARDREEELAAVARRLKAAHRDGDDTPLHRHALIVRRPLPYLYLARSVFGGAGVPFETLDTLPLAAEPFAAALDLVLDYVASGFARPALVALLGSPHFQFDDVEGGVLPGSLAALDRALAEARYLGGLERLQRLAADWSAIEAPASREERRQHTAAPAARVAVAVAEGLAPLAGTHAVAGQLGVIETFLARHRRGGRIRDAGTEVPALRTVHDAGTEVSALRTVHDAGTEVPALRTNVPDERLARVERAVRGALAALAHAYASHDPEAAMSGADVSFAIRRWLGAQTFATRSGGDGVRLLDAQAARFAEVDDVQLMGLVEGEWPETTRRSIFYPPFLLGLLDPLPAADDPNQRESDAMAAARAMFLDLLLLARRRVRVSTFSLEADAVVEPSPFVDEVTTSGLERDIAPPVATLAVSADEALLADPPVVDPLTPLAREWAALRLPPPPGDPRYAGEAGPWVFGRISVSRIDRYLKCPFQFFASEVLRLEEEPEDEDAPPPWERGRFLHALFETFFREWQEAGYGSITAARVPEARTRLLEVAERALATLPAIEAALERARLVGSAAGPGIIDRVLSMEAERPDPIDRRLIEYSLDAPFTFRRADGTTRTVPLRAQIDRVDLLRDGRFRVIDYKSRIVPDPKRTVQLQVYTTAVAQQLARQGAHQQVPGEAFYLSMEGESPIKALKPAKGQTLDDLLAEAEDRMIRAIEDVGEGHFPPRPVMKSLCARCPFDSVCRKAYVEATDA